MRRISFNRLLGQKAGLSETIFPRSFRSSVFEDFHYGEGYTY